MTMNFHCYRTNSAAGCADKGSPTYTIRNKEPPSFYHADNRQQYTDRNLFYFIAI